MKPEAKVGLLFIVTLLLVVAFSYYIGAFGLLTNSHDLIVQYNFAGGVDVGSPVRVMGIKVGKVKEISFDPEGRDAAGHEVKLKVRISIEKKAWTSIRKDSRFYINLAGVIGEKFVEITPGTSSAPALSPNDSIRGEDPPRIDQLISQSYSLAGKILDIVEKNEGSVTETLESLERLVKNFNQTLLLLDKMSKNQEISRLLKNVMQITDDLAALTPKLRGPEAEKTYDLIHKLLWRLNDLDSKAIHKFLQEEGIKAKLF